MNNITATEESTQTYDSGQEQQEVEPAPENSYTDSEVDFADESDSTENTNEADVTFNGDTEDAEQAGSDDSCFFALEENAEDVGDGEATPTPAGVVTGTFRVSGQIAYNETLGGTDWSALTRPDEFDQPIKVGLTYVDSNGKEQALEYDVQEDLSQNAFYLKFAHDGNGGGDFTIENIPKTIKDTAGAEYQVTKCSVYVKPKLPYYNSDSVNIEITDPTNISTALGTLTLNLKSQTLTLNPTVIPANGSDNPSFKMNMTFTNPQLTSEADKDRVLNKSMTPTKNNASDIQVPFGIAYKVTQDTASGYRFDGTYTTTVNSTDPTVTPTPTPATSTSSGSAEGTIEEGKNVTISTVNYAQNVEVKFDVNWIDNNKATRPALSESNFVLQYKVTKKDGTSDWKELTSEDYTSLGITAAPGFGSSKNTLNQYAYTGLPAVDAEENPLEYQVAVRQENIPAGYVAETKDNTETNRRIFTFEEQTSFQATIAWNDLHESSHRPSDDTFTAYRNSLKLYRKVEDGKYELVADGLTKDQLTVGEGSAWSVNIPDIPRYNSDNKEYDYVLVQGTIDENGKASQTPVNEFYKTYYDNGSGSFGNDVALCHNNGKITEVVHKTVNFQADKIWKDPNGSGETRPTSTVTLWRYIKGTANDIDDAYAKGVAAQVVFQATGTDGKIKENIVSYQIDNTKDSTIMFTGGESGTVDEMANDYEFPAYDDHGREYVYFVRESLSGTSADEFDIQYTSTTTNEDGTTQTITYKNGAPANGTITNVRRKKEAVAVTKLWQNPADLSEIDGLSVQVRIKASTDGGQTYEELPVYSETDGSYETLTDEAKKNAQTISGFTSSISQGEVTYYVNTYDSQGQPYDMTTAQIIETVISKDGKTYEVNSDGTITINGSTYKVTSSYVGATALGNGMNQYRYTQKNTITATREYTLTKVWGENIGSDEIKDITAVNFKLQRRSTKDNADGTTAEFEDVLNADGTDGLWSVSKDDNDRTWTSVLSNLPRYDEDGYEYYYQATEVSFTKSDGTTFTVENAQTQNKWYGVYYRTPDQTQVTNRKYTSDGGFFTVSKIWQDNGDTANRKDVAFRVYRRDQLKAALEKQQKDRGKANTDIVDLDKLYLSSGQDSDVSQGADKSESLKYYSGILSSGIANYTKYVYYTELEKAIDGQEKTSHTDDEWKEYILLEYQVGSKDTDGAEMAQYTYQQLFDAAGSSETYQISGTVSNSLRKYNTKVSFQNNSGRLVLLTNTRTGSSEIKAEKTWKDDENASGLRPSSVRFQLYRDGSPYTNISESVTVKAENVQTGNSGENDSGNKILGTAVTNDKGYLVWKSITPEGYDSKLIYGAAGQCITKADDLVGSNTTADTDFSSFNCSIILKQNQNGYVFTESYAPDPVHNDGRSYHVSITAENYKRNTTGDTKYNTEKYINLVEAEANTTGTLQHTVTALSERETTTAYKNPSDVNPSYTTVSEVEGKLAVNLPYQSTVKMHKYDADEEGQKAAIPGTEFTLYRDSVAADNIYKKAYSVTQNTDNATVTKTENTTGVFTTDADGNITIEIHEKGTYILKETKAAAGYQLASDTNTFTFTLADKAQTDASGNKTSYGYGEINTLQIDSEGVPNQRIMGEVTLTKKDARTGETLDGVVYTLTRTDVPKVPPTGSTTALTDYLLKKPVDVITGHSYKAEKNADGKWQLTDVTNSTDATDPVAKTGEIHISGLNWGTCTLTEKTELSGYKKVINTHSFTIDGKNNKLSFTFNDTNEKNRVTFCKTNQIDPEAGVTDEAGIKCLAGAVFEVHEGDVTGTCTKDAFGNTTCTKAEFYKSDTDNMTDAQGKSTKVTTVTAGSDGKVTIYGLPTDTTSDTSKTYHLVEVKAPKGYKLQTTPIVFNIDRQGKVQIKGENGAYTDAPSVDPTTDPSVTHPMITMQDEAIKLYIQKYGEDGTTALNGAVFELTDTCSGNSGEANCNHTLANGKSTETIKITADEGKVMIPIERIIGGHTYQLKETKAPDGYECTAIVTFHVKEDGTIDELSSEGGYKGYTDANGDKVCAALDGKATTINIRDEKIAMTLTKVDYDDNKNLLAGVTFTLKPYGTVIGSTEQSSFTKSFDLTGFMNVTYEESTDTYTFITDDKGKITFPPGLLKHDNSYLLRETNTAQNYYLGKEAQGGVILKVDKNGGITIQRLEIYKDNTITENGTTISSCPITVKTNSKGESNLIAKNMKATSFELTKKVEGNMGDLNGTFKIKMEVYEPDGTKVGERTVNLKMNQTYDSETGFTVSGDSDNNAFGIGAIPVGATLVISEDNDLDYTAVVKITGTDGSSTVISSTEADKKGTVKVKLNSTTKVSIELTNKKDVAIDVGVNTENQTPWAAVSLIIPALWLAYRYRRKRKGGDA